MPTPGSPVVPTDHTILVAVRDSQTADRCKRILIAAGYTSVSVLRATDASSVIAFIEACRPHLLLIDHAIEWAPGIPLVLRIAADRAFADLPMLIFLPLEAEFPVWMGRDFSRSPFLTDPFPPEDLLYFVSRILELVIAGQGRPFPHRENSPVRKSADWEVWKEQMMAHALCDAARIGDRVGIEALLARGAHVRMRDSWGGITVLHAAARMGQEEMVRFLLERGADVNERTRYGDTPLWMAACTHQVATMRLLLEQGANPNAVSDFGGTALSSLFGRGGRTEEDRERQVAGAKLLLQYKINLNVKDRQGHTALHHLQKQQADIKRLLPSGADPNVDYQGGWVESLHAEQRHLSALERLLRANGARE